MAVGEASKPPHAHTVGEIEPLDMASAHPVFIAATEHWQLFCVGYLGWAVAG